MGSYSRYRTRGGFASPSSNTVVEKQRYNTCSALTWTSNTYDSLATGVKEEMFDTITPNWKARRAKGEVTFNSMTHTKRESNIDVPGDGPFITQNAISCAAPLLNYQVDLTGPWFARWIRPAVSTAPLDVGYVIPQNEVNDLVLEVSTKAQAKRGMAENNLFESVAEYRKTLQMLKSPVQAVHNFLNKNEKAIRRVKSLEDKFNEYINKPGKFVGHATAPASAWLAYRYGIKPLINDVSGIISGMKKQVGHRRVTARAQGEISRAETATSVWTNGTQAMTFSIQKTDYVKVRAMSLDEYEVSLANNIGFTSKGLITLPWELVPYSFVADWFVNFGDYLQAIAPVPFLKQLGSCVVTERGTSNVYQPIAYTRTGFTVNRPITGSCSSLLWTKTRSPILAPGIVIKNDFKLDDAVRLADSVSLLAQRLDSLFKRR